ncbi:hypothetical protein vBPpSSYP_7 [Pseudomonas phage vB_PpS_SYP]|nr:hypothetical protein vBPpSSYP_7 [Pseudomonas phage vB_PpS_SYP]
MNRIITVQREELKQERHVKDLVVFHLPKIRKQEQESVSFVYDLELNKLTNVWE